MFINSISNCRIKNNINFKKKLPVADIKIYDKNEDKLKQARIYEYDCKNLKEVQDFDKSMGKGWLFSIPIVDNMKEKYNNPRNNKNTKYYSMEDNKKNTIGIMECEIKEDNNLNVNLLETKRHSDYKYSGMALLAIASIEAKKNGNENLTIDYPLYSARNFYIDKCGFNQSGAIQLYVNNNGMDKLIKKVESKTDSKIIDLRS